MKPFIFILLLTTAFQTLASGLVHPSKFKGTESEKQEVINFIKNNVKKTYSAIGMSDPSTLRMMEKEELQAFKSLTKVTNEKLLNDVIKQYCAINMCNYSTIHMMYLEQDRASKEELTW